MVEEFFKSYSGFGDKIGKLFDEYKELHEMMLKAEDKHKKCQYYESQIRSIKRLNEAIKKGLEVKLTAWEYDTWFVKEIKGKHIETGFYGWEKGSDFVATNIPSLKLEDIAIQCNYCNNSKPHYLLMHYYRSVDDFGEAENHNKWLLCYCPEKLEPVDLGRIAGYISQNKPFKPNEIIVK